MWSSPVRSIFPFSGTIRNLPDSGEKDLLLWQRGHRSEVPSAERGCLLGFGIWQIEIPDLDDAPPAPLLLGQAVEKATIRRLSTRASSRPLSIRTIGSALVRKPKDRFWAMRGGCSRFLIGLSPWWLPHLLTSWGKHMRTRFFRWRSPTRWSPGCRRLIGNTSNCCMTLSMNASGCWNRAGGLLSMWPIWAASPTAASRPMSSRYSRTWVCSCGGRSSGESPRRWEGRSLGVLFGSHPIRCFVTPLRGSSWPARAGLTGPRLVPPARRQDFPVLPRFPTTSLWKPPLMCGRFPRRAPVGSPTPLHSPSNCLCDSLISTPMRMTWCWTPS